MEWNLVKADYYNRRWFNVAPRSLFGFDTVNDKELKMHTILTGSALTRAMLESGHSDIWCAIDDNSDEQAMTDHGGNDFTAHITSFYDGKFFCTGGMPWTCAVPVKISELSQSDIGL